MSPWVAFIVLAAVTFCPYVRGDGIFSARTGPVTFPINVQDPKYAINFRPLSARNPVTLAASQELIPMTASDGQKYACILPGPISQVASTENGSELEEADVKTPEDIINNLAEKPCYYQINGWWTYEICYKRHVRQFHAERDELMSEYYLGMYDEEATRGEIEGENPFSTDQRYISHVYTNGTECDLTGNLRQTEVRYVCSDEEKDQLLSLKEGPTCRYTLIFGSEDLCNHVLFKKVIEPINTIECYLLPGEEEDDDRAEEDTTIDVTIS